MNLEISFCNLNNYLDHSFARINKVRQFERIVLLKTSTDDERKLGAAENNLRAIIIFLKLFQEDNKIINDLFALVTSFDSINDALEKILVVFARGDWLDASSL